MKAQDELATQYRNSSNLAARQRIYRFATSRISFGQFVMARMNLPRGAQVLELGCGHGSFWATERGWVDKGWRLVLTDLSAGMLEEARARLAALGNVKLTRADAQRIPFAEHSFDAALASHMLYHVPDRRATFREVRRVLKPGGKFYSTTNSIAHLREIRQLVEQFWPGGMSMGQSGHLDWFSLDTGGEQMSPHFESVTQERLTGELHVIEAQAVVDYICSIESVQAEEREDDIERVRAQVQEQIDRQGAFVIRTETGLFTATC